MKKACTIILALIAVALAVWTFILYFVPEQEIAEGENTPEVETEAPTDTTMPVYGIDGAEVSIGRSSVDVLLSAGFSLKFEKDGKSYSINTEEKNAEAGKQYKVLLYKGESCIADLIYMNGTKDKQAAGACTIEALYFDTAREGYGAAAVLADGIDPAQTAIEDIPQKFSGYEKTNALYPEYRKAVMSDTTSVITTFSARGEDGKKITNFGTRDYLPAAGTE